MAARRITTVQLTGPGAVERSEAVIELHERAGATLIGYSAQKLIKQDRVVLVFRLKAD